MMRSKRISPALVLVAIGVLAMPGCDDSNPTDVPVDQQVESGLNGALQNTVIPLAAFMGAVGTALSSPFGAACPSTTGWCTAGDATCTQGANGLDFAFDACRFATADDPLVLDGDVTAIPGSPVRLTLNGLSINGSASMSGTGTVDTGSCDVTVNVHTSSVTVVGTVTQCDQDPFPTGETVAIGFSGYLVTVVLDGTATPHATATKDGTPVASCTIALDTLTSTCDAL